MSKKPMGLNEVRKRVAGLSKEQRNAMVCALVGHSQIVTTCFGYVHCGRCEAQVADQLGGIWGSAKESVIVGHACPTCKKNYRRMGWKDKLYVADPFKKAKAA